MFPSGFHDRKSPFVHWGDGLLRYIPSEELAAQVLRMLELHDVEESCWYMLVSCGPSMSNLHGSFKIMDTVALTVKHRIRECV